MSSVLPPDQRQALSSIRFRRAITLVLMTVVLPGSAQLVAGRRQVGRIALRIWFSLWATALLVVLLGLLSQRFGIWFATNSSVQSLARWGLPLLGVGWAFLIVDAWRLGQPLTLVQRQRLIMVGLNFSLCFALLGTLFYAGHTISVGQGALASLFSGDTVTKPHKGRYNVLLLGGDSGVGRTGLRPDSLTVASIDAETGKTVLFGLPRNMLNFPFRPGSVMATQFPDGYNCGPECELNSLATWAADHKELFGDVANPGVEATIQGVEGITGLRINYYAMVNLRGFKEMVDAVGGVRLTVRDRIPIGGVGGPVTGYIEPGTKKLNGYQTLWFARSRESADDYSRMARQKCVMNAMLQQLSPQTVVLKFNALAQASSALISTDIPRSEVDNFVDLALKARSYPVKTVSFVPPMINTGRPDIDKIRSAVKNAIKPGSVSASSGTSGSAVGTKPSSTPSATAAPAGDTTGGAIGSLRQGYAANQAENLGSAC